MLREKARIDRGQDLSRDTERPQWSRLLRLIQSELREDEYFGEPFRSSIGVIIPIEVGKPGQEPG